MGALRQPAAPEALVSDFPASEEGPKVLPGKSSVILIISGNVTMLIAGCFVPRLAFESKFKSIEDVYAGVLLTVIGIGIMMGYGVIRWGIVSASSRFSRAIPLR